MLPPSKRTIAAVSLLLVLLVVFLLSSQQGETNHLVEQQVQSVDRSATASTGEATAAQQHKSRRRQNFHSRWMNRVRCSGVHNNNTIVLKQPMRSDYVCELDRVWLLATIQWIPAGVINNALVLVVQSPPLTPQDEEENRKGRNIGNARRLTRRREYDFPRTLFGPRFRTTVEQRDEGDDYYLNSSVAPGEMTDTAVFLPLHYGFDHPTHSLENLGVLLRTLTSSSVQKTTPRRIQRLILPIRKRPRRDSLQYQALRTVLNAANLSSVPIVGISDRNLLVGRLFVVGAVYSLFPDSETAAQFQRLFYAHNLAETSQHSDSAAAALPPRKKLVFFQRSSGRKIVDQSNVVAMIRRAALDIEIVIVNAGAMTSQQLFQAISDASVLVGVHGADLTNLLYLDPKRDTALIEINPILFFEPRFHDIAQKLADSNLRYFAFNCNSPACAFGGDRAAFHARIVKEGGVRYHGGGSFSSVSNESVSGVRWPITGFVADPAVCGQTCLDLIGRSGLRDRFLTLRDTDVRVLGDAVLTRSFANLLLDAFGHVGWIDKKDHNSRDKWLRLMVS